MRPKLTTDQRIQRLIYRVEHGRKCAACHAHKPYAGFSRDATRVDGLYPQCKDCQRTQRTLRALGLDTWRQVRRALRVMAANKASGAPS